MIEPIKVTSAAGAKFIIRDDKSILATGDKPATDTYTVVCRVPLTGVTAFLLEALPDDSLPKKGPGRSANGNFVLTEITVKEKAAGGDERAIELQNATASFEQEKGGDATPYGRFSAAGAIDGDTKGEKFGWAVLGRIGQSSVAAFETKADTMATPSAKAAAENAAVGSSSGGKSNDAKASAGPQLIFTLKQNYGGDHTLGRFRLWATATPRPVRASDADVTSLPEKIRELLHTPAKQRSEAQRNELAAFYRTIAPVLEPQRTELARLKDQRNKLEDTIPQVLATVSAEPRTMRVLPRGNWMDDSGPIVTPAPPQHLPQQKVEGRRATRLDLARWLTSRENPLTARVFVNRLWKLYFGAGLSKRLDDLGSQGDWPSHPELLDWLASELVDSGWDIKHVVRLLVT